MEKEYDFLWDFAKERVNLEKHGIEFGEASSVLLDPHAATVFDDAHSADEDRWVTIGLSNQGRLLLVCHTFEEETFLYIRIRIFSARKPNRREVEFYVRSRG